MSTEQNIEVYIRNIFRIDCHDEKTTKRSGLANLLTQYLGFEAWMKCFERITTFCRHAIESWCPMKCPSCDHCTYSLENVKMWHQVKSSISSLTKCFSFHCWMVTDLLCGNCNHIQQWCHHILRPPWSTLVHHCRKVKPLEVRKHVLNGMEFLRHSLCRIIL